MKELQSIDEIETQCQYEIERRHLDKLIKWVAELHLLRVSPETLQYLKEGNWEDIDHLQFFVAVLHGYWGKNSAANVEGCACFHLGEMRQKVVDDKSLWKCQLCAIGFCLFCEDIHVALYQDGFKFHPELPNQLPFYLYNLPDEADLPWISRFHECKECDRYIELLNGEIPSIKISDYYKRVIKGSTEHYDYSKEDFEGALNALYNYIFSSTRQHGYNMKDFDNKPSRDEGRMQCFGAGERYAEMWVTQSKPPDTDIIRRCRFVYEYYNNFPNEGNLYFTDSHYGWDIIDETKVEERLKRQDKHKYTQGALKKLDFYGKLSGLSKRNLYDLQDEIKEGFPFCKIGHLNLNTLELTKDD